SACSRPSPAADRCGPGTCARPRETLASRSPGAPRSSSPRTAYNSPISTARPAHRMPSSSRERVLRSAGLHPASGSTLFPAAAPPALHEIVRAREAALALERPAPVEALEPGARRSFCVVQGLDFSHHVRKAATLAIATAHAEMYVDDDDLGEYEVPALQPLAQAFEETVWPAVTSAFGLPTDVDASGKLTVLITHELGAHLNGGWLIGYFGNADLVRARDDSPQCSGGGSNHGEIVYLNDPGNGAANGYAAADLFARVYPSTIAHEMQHLLNFAHRCVERSCDGPEQTWINEALSKVAEDLAGYGWNAAAGRAEGATYLRRGAGQL